MFDEMYVLRELSAMDLMCSCSFFIVFSYKGILKKRPFYFLKETLLKVEDTASQTLFFSVCQS